MVRVKLRIEEGESTSIRCWQLMVEVLPSMLTGKLVNFIARTFCDVSYP